MKKNILFVGDNPILRSENGNMLSAILSQIDTDLYKAACFVSGGMISDPFVDQPFNIINSEEPEDILSSNKLLSILNSSQIDYLIMVGLDIWQYAHIFSMILEIKKRKPFCWIAIFPYDSFAIRKDWVDWINCVDIPCVYSQYGYNLLKDHVPNLQYYKPAMWSGDVVYEQYEPEKRANVRHKHFKEVSDSQFIIGCIAKNQVRKDIPKLIGAFLLAKEKNLDLVLYLHTEFDASAVGYNLKQMASDMGAKTGDIISKRQGVIYSEKQMVDVYNSIDCLVNCSAQEGLSWTVLEAMLCGTPVIGSRTTSQTELIEGAGTLITPVEVTYIPVVTKGGKSHINSLTCATDAIKQAILDVASDVDLQKEMRKAGLKRSEEWLSDVSDINDVLNPKQIQIKSTPKIEKILFAQHSAAGDVLMTTQCFKGIKERHDGMDLIYMTQPQFQDIVKGNPYVDEIIDWNENLLNAYEIVYNPHGDHILHGAFNSLDVKLYSMYPYFCGVEADEMFIKEMLPLKIPTELPKEYIVVHTTGGMAEYRTYRHMDMVIKNIGIPVVQIGGGSDMVCHEAIDLRKKLSWREAAWVMNRAKAAVVIDSFPSYLAGALGTPVVVLYGPAPERVVGPRVQDKDDYIALEPDMLQVCRSMTRCWGLRNRQIVKCLSPCINTISPEKIRNALNHLIKQSDRRPPKKRPTTFKVAEIKAEAFLGTSKNKGDI